MYSVTHEHFSIRHLTQHLFMNVFFEIYVRNRMNTYAIQRPDAHEQRDPQTAGGCDVAVTWHRLRCVNERSHLYLSKATRKIKAATTRSLYYN